MLSVLSVILIRIACLILCRSCSRTVAALYTNGDRCCTVYTSLLRATRHLSLREAGLVTDGLAPTRASPQPLNTFGPDYFALVPKSGCSDPYRSDDTKMDV